MSIPVACGGCGKRFKAPDRGAGKQVPCPACKTIISIPALANQADAEDEYRLAEEPLPPPSAAPHPLLTTPPPRQIRPPTAASLSVNPVAERSNTLPVPSGTDNRPTAKAWVPPTRSSTPNWLRHLHWCLALAMLPLAVSIIVPERSESKIIAEAQDGPPVKDAMSSETGGATRPSGEQSSAGESAPDEPGNPRDLLSQISENDLFAALPGRKLPGALLARDSYLHWLFAFIAATAFMAFLVFLASDKSAQPLHLLGLGLFTATFGILLLFFVQLASTIGVIRVGGAAGFVLLVLAMIGLSYSAALSPDTGLIGSFLGFTCGVGLCEEVCKALPILIYYRVGNKQNWRGAFLWGLASGTGFGVSEAIMYSQDLYNGIAGPGIYVVRFVSCVALHAIWAGSIGISINQRQDLLQEDFDEWWWYALAVLRLIAVPMVLHGLYDTLLKKDLELLALLTAVASFGYLAWQISHLRHSDDEDERAAYVSQYIRAKASPQH